MVELVYFYFVRLFVRLVGRSIVQSFVLSCVRSSGRPAFSIIIIVFRIGNAHFGFYSLQYFFW